MSAPIRDVAQAFVDGRAAYGSVASNGYPRVSSTGYSFYSYATVIASYLPNREPGIVLVSERRYSTATGNHVRHVQIALHRAGYAPTGLAILCETRVPGRWNGAGLPWHPTGWQLSQFEIWTTRPIGEWDRVESLAREYEGFRP